MQSYVSDQYRVSNQLKLMDTCTE